MTVTVGVVTTGESAAAALGANNRDLASTGDRVSALFDAGANSISGPEFAVAEENVERLTRQAEAEALREARAQADATASVLGMRVARVLLVSDSHPAKSPSRRATISNSRWCPCRSANAPNRMLLACSFMRSMAVCAFAKEDGAMGDFSIEFKERISAAMLADLAGSVPLSVTGHKGKTYGFEADFGADKTSLKGLRQAIEQVTGKNSIETLERLDE